MAGQSLTMQQNFNTSELAEQNELFDNEFDIELFESDSEWFDSDDFNLPESENDF